MAQWLLQKSHSTLFQLMIVCSFIIKNNLIFESIKLAAWLPIRETAKQINQICDF